MTIEQLVPGFRAESALERELAGDPALLQGLAWGHPRPGHPEGAVGIHVADILASITDKPGRRRSELRFLAVLHDACKHRVRPEAGRVRDNDHAFLARRLAERYTRDQRLLVALELHDTPYRIWRTRTRTDDRRAALRGLLATIPDLDLFLHFVDLDGSTDGKQPGPLEWIHGVTATHALQRLAA